MTAVETTARQAYVRNVTLENSDWYMTYCMSYLARQEDTDGAFTLLELAGASGYEPPPHLHTREDELFFLLDGEATFQAGDRSFHAMPGSLIYLPHGVPHQFQIHTEKARALMMVTPSGFEGYFKGFSVPAKNLEEFPTLEGELDVARMLSLGAEYGVEFLPPGTTPTDRPALPGSGQPVFVAPNTGEILNVLGIPVEVLLNATQSDGQMSLFISHDAPGQGVPQHIHRREDESFYVLEGEYLLQIGEEIEQVGAGTFAHCPRGVRHAYKSVGENPGRLLVITTPGGFEGFFRDVDALMRSENVTVSGLMAVGERHQVEIVGPPIGE